MNKINLAINNLQGLICHKNTTNRRKAESKSHSFSGVAGYGTSIIVDYLMPNPFYAYKQFYFKQYSLVQVYFLVCIQLNVKNSSISNNSAEK